MIDVSIIIPIYNTEKYLSACINSILNQKNISLEIILVDDGSTDASARICDEYANKHSNIKVIHINNSGQAIAKNEGLKYAQGRFITFTDSDDKMGPMMLYKMVSSADKFNADIVCCNYKEVDEQGYISHTNCTNQQYILNHEEALIHFYSRNKIYSQCWTKLYSHRLLTESNIKNEPIRYDEDIIFNIRAFKSAQTTIIIDEPLYEYTYRKNSVAHGFWNFKKNLNQYIDDRLKRVLITKEAVINESVTVKEYSQTHIIIYYNELLGRVAAYPEFHSDPRIKKIIKDIKKNKATLNKYYHECGFSNIGRLLILYLPSSIYMKYRKFKL